MTDMQMIAQALNGMVSEKRMIEATLSETLMWVDEARAKLRGIGQACAREAESLASQANTAVRETVTVWMADFERRSNDLNQELAK